MYTDFLLSTILRTAARTQKETGAIFMAAFDYRPRLNPFGVVTPEQIEQRLDFSFRLKDTLEVFLGSFGIFDDFGDYDFHGLPSPKDKPLPNLANHAITQGENKFRLGIFDYLTLGIPLALKWAHQASLKELNKFKVQQYFYGQELHYSSDRSLIVK